MGCRLSLLAPPTPTTPPPPLLLFLDWDSTLTTHSTLPLIASIATTPNPSPHLAPLSHSYALALTAHETAHPHARDTVQSELRYLDSLRPVEEASVARLEACGLFGGVRPGHVDAAASEAVKGGKVVLRAGWGQLCGVVQRGSRGGGGGGRVGVVSVAWSARFVRRVLELCCGARGGCCGVEVEVNDVDIFANDILPDGSGRLDRKFGPADGGGAGRGGAGRGGGIYVAGDKLFAMRRLVETCASSGHTILSRPLPPRTIYIGDSPTDLACLLHADVGICVRDEPMSGEQRELKETLERVGVGCAFVGDFEDVGGRDVEGKVGGRDEQGGKGEEGCGGEISRRLWWARDFNEVVRSGIVK